MNSGYGYGWYFWPNPRNIQHLALPSWNPIILHQIKIQYYPHNYGFHICPIPRPLFSLPTICLGSHTVYTRGLFICPGDFTEEGGQESPGWEIAITELGKVLYQGDFNFNFNFITFNKRKIQNGCFPQIALASRGGKQQEGIGLPHSLSNLDKVWRK